MRFTTAIRYGLARMLLKAGGLTIIPQWLNQSFLTPTFINLVREGYQKNSVVTACITTLTVTFPEPPLLVWDSEDDDAKPIPRHPLRVLLRKPNNLMGEDELWQYTIAYAAIGGNAYWHKVRDGGRRVIRLMPYHAGQIRAVPGGDEWVLGYEYNDGSGTWRPIPKDDIVHFKWPLPDPEQPWQAQPPLRSVAPAVDTDSELDRYLFALLKNDAVPRIVITLPNNVAMEPDEKARLREQWRERYGGNNRGDLAVLDDGATIQRLGLDLEQLAFDALRKVPEARIAAAFRVPPILAGLNVGLETATYSNYEQARKAFTQDLLVPLWRAWAAEVESALAPEFGNGVSARHDLTKVASLQQDVNALWTRVDKAFNSGYLSFQESRMALGFGEPQRQDLFAVPMARDLLPFVDIINPPEPIITVLPPKPPPQLPAPSDRAPDDGKPEPQEQPPKALGQRQTKQSAAAAQRIARKLQKARVQTARRMEGAVDAFFSDLADQVVSRLGKSWRPKMQRKDLPGVDALILADDWLDLRTLVKRYYVEVLEASWPVWNSALGVEVAFELTDPAVVAALKTAGSRVADISETTRGFLAQVLQDGADAGLTIGELVPGIRTVIEESYKGRARAIARTELATAQNVTTYERYKATGVAHVTIFDNGQDDPDDECAAVNNTTQTLEWFKDNPLAHPNCTRCAAPSFD